MSDITSFESGGRRRRGARIFWGVFVVLVAAAAWLLFAPRGALEPETVQVAEPDHEEVVAKPLTLYFADEDAQRLISEEREIPPGGDFEQRVISVIAALADGPERQDAVRTIPVDASVRRVYRDEQGATVYLDFDPTLVTHHPGGSAAEGLTIGSILHTIGANFPDIQQVQILVDGATIESIAGHFDTSRPLQIAAWP